jgi:glycosyltransferase involved in cell wall biosynthesis
VHLVPALFGRGGLVGGAERYVFELARHMAERVNTRLVTFGDAPSVTTSGPLTVHVLGPARQVRGQRSNPFSWHLLGALASADVVHCHQQHIVATSVAAMAARLRGQCVFCTDLGGGGWDISGYVSTDRLFHGHLHISDYSRHVFGHETLPTAHVIYGGVDTTRFTQGQPSDPSIDCLFVGRLLPHKGVDVMLEAVPEDFETVVIGPAPDSRYLADLQSLARGKRVTFRHDCDDDAIVAAYRSARVVVLPSLYEDRYGGTTRVPELLGQTLLEGMACGTPALCTGVASLPEVVEDGVTGRVVAPHNRAAMREALLWFRDHPDERRRMGEAGRARVLSKFTWPAVVDRCLELYAGCTGIS